MMAPFGITPQTLPRLAGERAAIARAAQRRADQLAWRLFALDVNPAVRAGAAAALAVGSAQAALLPSGLAPTFAAAAAVRAPSLLPLPAQPVSPQNVQILPLLTPLTTPGAAVPERAAIPVPAASASAVAASGATSPAEQQVLTLVNRTRSEHGLKPLSLDRRLSAAAAGHAQQMARTGTMDHEGIGDGTPRERISAAGVRTGSFAENVAMGQTSPDEVMRGWMNSPGHRRNILDPGLTTMGVAVAPDATGTPYWTQNFA